ncbi:beta-ketoacyl synthase N-terminal-like domain-containing protein [Streptomyces sp. NPDC014727]|uniref:beta-ketoacyl synthase N-terminal-like domain-containing protein n=1 Tax=Streptomyces sp. NPDC014727 TaxID=3364883 RepID=UPI0036F93BD3
MDEREILTRFKAGTLERGQAVRLLAELEAAPGPGPQPVLSPAPGRAPSQTPGPNTPKTPSKVPHSAEDADDRFAVFGIVGRYPLAPDLRVYWQNVREGRDTSSPAPLGRPGAPPLGTGQRGHFLDGAADFDADFFGLTAHRASLRGSGRRGAQAARPRALRRRPCARRRTFLSRRAPVPGPAHRVCARPGRQRAASIPLALDDACRAGEPSTTWCCRRGSAAE